VDTYLAITSKRDTRRYAPRPIPADVVDRILDAGRVAGSARNRQPWRFVVIEDGDARERIAETVYEPDNVRGAALVVVLVCTAAFDGGRAAQNMMLAAWNDGVASCPNGMPDRGATARLLRLEGEDVLAVLTFGYPARHPGAESRSADMWSARADRKALTEVVRRL
jgi:nitroreductase